MGVSYGSIVDYADCVLLFEFKSSRLTEISSLFFRFGEFARFQTSNYAFKDVGSSRSYAIVLVQPASLLSLWHSGYLGAVKIRYSVEK